MSSENPQDLLKLAVEVAAEAAQLIVERRRGTITVADTKSTTTDIVTAVDRESEELIRARVLAARPDDSFLGEEGDDVNGSSGVRWVVDPIDGTVNYLYDIPTYAVSIAVEYDGRTVAGVVVDAPKGEMFTATLGGGAFLDGRPIRVSECADLSKALVGTGFGYDPVRREVQAEVLASLIAKVRDVRRIGVGAIDLCYVACGRLDAVYERGLNPWDYGAGALIAAEAGAQVGGLDGAPVSPEMSIAATPAVFGPLHDALVAANPLRS
ncbi:inositol monophosphatase family protein [Kribbella sp. CA-293567]|uniref:inositol monophosphatase family protein n=1 Tax=Kribbella sp. CA-293567 TaxID=3002436 RepID=UPI0022DE888E|nr:inositol monophosphatase family protein [Kribbella sp. CA-293567]WBQ02265.1 inositol monophosphatase family protein [Kribbella sp. CA-293567]